MLTCKVGETIINCFDGTYDKYTLKKWSNKNKLICPDCGKPYEYCHGRVMIPYFRHKEKNIECDGVYSEPETPEHINGKLILYKKLLKIQEQGIIKNLKLEAYIPETKQRPDIYFETQIENQRFVLEYQCSPIATEYLERHELYQLASINDIWIMGLSKYNIDYNDNYVFRKIKRLKEIEKHSLYYLNSSNGDIIINSVLISLYLKYNSFDLDDYYKYNLNDVYIDFKNKRISLNDSILDEFKLIDENNNSIVQKQNSLLERINYLTSIKQNTSREILLEIYNNLLPEERFDLFDYLLFVKACIDLYGYKNAYNVSLGEPKTSQLAYYFYMKDRHKNLDDIYAWFDLTKCNDIELPIDYELRSDNNIKFVQNTITWIKNDDSWSDFIEKIHNICDKMIYPYQSDLTLPLDMLPCLTWLIKGYSDHLSNVKYYEDRKQELFTKIKDIYDKEIILIDGYYRIDNNIRFKFLKEFDFNSDTYIVNDFADELRKINAKDNIYRFMLRKEEYSKGVFIKRNMNFILGNLKKVGFTNVYEYKINKEV